MIRETPLDALAILQSEVWRRLSFVWLAGVRQVIL
jgi:hypothetical protein